MQHTTDEMQHATEEMQHATYDRRDATCSTCNTYTIAAPKYEPRPNVSSCFDWEKTESFFITRTYASVTALGRQCDGTGTGPPVCRHWADPFALKSTA